MTASTMVKKKAGLVLVASAMAVASAGVAAANLTDSGSTFASSDGDLAGANDWNGLSSSVLDCTSTPKLNCGIDRPTGATDDSFGQGTSEDTAVPSPTSGSIPNNKSDLSRFYVAHATNTDASKTFLYLAWERVQDPSGTTNMDFELNQSKTLSVNGVTPTRTSGDLLVNYDLSSGGSHPTIGYRKWRDGSEGSAGAATVCEASNKFPCWSKVQPIASDFSEGTVNDVALTDGDTIAPFQPRSLSARTFGEAGIDLNGAGIFKSGECTGYGSAYLKSRSSDSFTAAVKDYIAPVKVDVNNCSPAVLTIKKVKSGTSTTLPGAEFRLYKDSGPATTAAPSRVANVVDATDTVVLPDVPTVLKTTCLTAANGIGNCTYTVAASAASNGTYIAKEITPPPGYQPTLDQTHVVTISGGNSDHTFTFSDTTAPGRIVAEKLADTGTATIALPLAGAEFILLSRGIESAPSPTAIAAVAADTASVDNPNACTTVVGAGVIPVPADGQGTCSFEQVALGSYWLVERTAPANYFLPTTNYRAVTVGLGNAANTGQSQTVTVYDLPKYKVITIVCNQATNALKASSVTLDGSTQTTTTSSTSAAATLCGETSPGAVFSGKAAGAVLNGTVTP